MIDYIKICFISFVLAGAHGLLMLGAELYPTETLLVVATLLIGPMLFLYIKERKQAT